MSEATSNSSMSFSKTLAQDFTSGLVVALVALPLCLGIALASNVPLISGLVAGIIGGLVISWLSGSQTSVSGPAAGLTAVVATQSATLGSFDAFLTAVMLAGVLQITLGVFKAGSLAVFFPSSVIKGLLATIGVILILKQIPHLFGHDLDWLGDMSFKQSDGENTFSELIVTWFKVHPGVSLIGLLSFGILVFWDRSFLKKIPMPAPLFVVIFGVSATYLLAPLSEIWMIGESHLVNVPVTDSLSSLFGGLSKPDLSAVSRPEVYMAAVTLCIVASLETLLNLEAVDKIDPKGRVSPPNQEFICTKEALGSLEYACALAGAKLLIVLGHTQCGAVKATHQDRLAKQNSHHANSNKLAHDCVHIKSITQEINHAFDQLEPRDERLDNLAYLNRATELNVERTQANILEESPVLAQLVEQGDLLCVGGIYNVASGAIKWLE